MLFLYHNVIKPNKIAGKKICPYSERHKGAMALLPAGRQVGARGSPSRDLLLFVALVCPRGKQRVRGGR